ncbi:MAG: phosphatase PAP2 family protein [Acidobacteriota bacterium]|nr:phosphatase PAP2 family protein [Acidobacteriota bacterium]
MQAHVLQRFRGILAVAAAAAFLEGCASTTASRAPTSTPTPSPTPPAATPSSRPDEPAPEAASPRSLPGRLWEAVVHEAARYVSDAAAFVVAPGHWDAADWRRVAGSGATLGVLFVADESVDSFARKQRSRFTDRVSGATTWIGGAGGFRIPVAVFVGGVLFRDAGARDIGRDAVEACLFSAVVTKSVKNVAGRKRPFETDGETTFSPFSSRDSFPSGHATQAFAIASVVAMRSNGWVLPALAYTTATVVAMDRVNDRVHFASDVAAGAIIGTVTGRFLVARHRREEAGKKPRVDIELVPIRSGLAARIRY